MSENKQPKRYYHGSIFWPLILITVGVVLLLQNLGISGGFWDTIIRFWPVIFIAIALDGLIWRKEIFGPALFGGLGVVLLFNNFDLLGWGVWNVLWRLWPLLVVAIGVEIIFGRRYVWLSAIGVAIVLVALVGALWLGMIAAPESSQETIQEMFGEATQADITISPAVGVLNVDDLVDSKELIVGTASNGDGATVSTRSSSSGDKVIIAVETRHAVIFPSGKDWDWDFSLTSQIPIDLETAMGVGDMNLELANLTLSDLKVNQGVGEVSVSLPNGDYRVDISQAIGSLVVEVPEDAAVRLDVSRAISGLSVPAGYDRRGDYYYSTGYDKVDDHIDLAINQAIGSIVVRYEK
jgi:hypothetical protein